MKANGVRVCRNKKLLHFMHLSRLFHSMDDLVKLKLLWKVVFQILCNCEDDNRETMGHGNAKDTLMHQVLLKGLYEYLDVIPLAGLKQMINSMETLQKVVIPPPQELSELYRQYDPNLLLVDLTAPSASDMEGEVSKQVHSDNESHLSTSPPLSSVSAAAQPISPSLSGSSKSVSSQAPSPPSLTLPPSKLKSKSKSKLRLKSKINSGETSHPLFSMTNGIYSKISNALSHAQEWIYGRASDSDDDDDEQISSLLAATHSTTRRYLRGDDQSDNPRRRVHNTHAPQSSHVSVLPYSFAQ
ncbi:hypothetical protein RFI_04217, partial [Reticulomyxa filosa]